MPRPPVPDDKIMALHVNGRTFTAIGKELGITRQYVAKVVKRYLAADASLTMSDEYRAAVRLEVTQENALTELITQLNDYNEEYVKAGKGGDKEMQSRWAALRLKTLDLMNKVTGLYDERKVAAQEYHIVWEDEGFESEGR
jgi:DNA-binding MarR family transcriptional regulator